MDWVRTAAMATRGVSCAKGSLGVREALPFRGGNGCGTAPFTAASSSIQPKAGATACEQRLRVVGQITDRRTQAPARSGPACGSPDSAEPRTSARSRRCSRSRPRLARPPAAALPAPRSPRRRRVRGPRRPGTRPADDRIVGAQILSAAMRAELCDDSSLVPRRPGIGASVACS